MLANLDNEVYFKKVFTDVEVFTAFVKDVLDIDIEVKKVETEKVLLNKVSAIKFKMDLFAEDVNNRTIVEIQKIDYDYSYDRFSHYFLANLLDVQQDSRSYAFAKDVYIIVVVTAAFKFKTQENQLIDKDVLLTDLNPRDLKGNVLKINNHKLVILNTTNIDPETPEAIRDWLDLIHQSIKNPEYPKINTSKKAISKAVKLADYKKVTPEQLYEAKIEASRKEAREYFDDIAREEGREEGLKAAKIEGIKKALQRGKLSPEEIAEDFEVSVDFVKEMLKK